MTQSGFGWVLLAVGVYGLLHSFTASFALKSWAEKAFGGAARRLYRLAYILFAIISLIPVLALARILPDSPIYTIPFPWALLTLAVQGLAGLGLLASVFQTDPWSFLGLRQIGTAPALVAGAAPEGLVTSGFYRYVRHPIYTFTLLALWLMPWVTWNSLALMIGLTVYVPIGIFLEERKLTAEFGEAYKNYRQRTPMLLPRLAERP